MPTGGSGKRTPNATSAEATDVSRVPRKALSTLQGRDSIRRNGARTFITRRARTTVCQVASADAHTEGFTPRLLDGRGIALPPTTDFASAS